MKAIPACIIDSVYWPGRLLQPGPADPGRSVPAMAGGEERAGGLEGWAGGLEGRPGGERAGQADRPSSLTGHAGAGACKGERSASFSTWHVAVRGL